MTESGNLPTRAGPWSHLFPRPGLHRRLLVSFLLVSLVPLFGSNAVGYLRSRTLVERQVRQYLHEITELQAGHVAEHVQQRLAYLSAVGAGNRFLQAAAERDQPGGDPTMRAAARPAAVATYLQRQIDEAEGQFSEMALISLDGKILASPAEHPRPYRSAGPASEPVTVVRQDGGGTPPSLRYVVPVTSQDGAVVAYLSGSISTADAPALAEFGGHVGGSVESFIVDPTGRPIFVSHPHDAVVYDKPLDSPLLGRPPGSEGHYVNASGVEVIATTAALPGSQWTFLAEIPAEAALGDLRSLQRLSVVLGAAFAFLVLAFGWFLAGGIVAPVGRLVDATRRVAAGNLQVRVPAGDQDEIGELSAAFNEMAQDLTESRDRIHDLHTREIERADQLATVGELAAGLAHEIKNPVVSIANGMDLVLRRVGGDPQLEPIAREMARQIERIEQAVRDLLAFARPRSPEKSLADLNDVIRRAATLVEPAATKTGVALKLELSRGLPMLSVDVEQIRQAVVNLAFNAVQHSGPGGVVRVETRAVGGRVEIAVADTGEGIPDEVRQHLFKPFFTTRHAGTGLGLSITRGIVERHGGTVSVRSVVGEGSTFTIALPMGPSTKGSSPDNEATS